LLDSLLQEIGEGFKKVNCNDKKCDVRKNILPE